MKNFLKILLIIFLTLLTCAMAVFGYVLDKLDRISYVEENELSTYPVVDPELDEEDDFTVDIGDLVISETQPVIPDTEINQDESVINILVLGTDERTVDFSSSARSDSMILVSIDKNKNTVRLVSFERGIGVPILEGKYAGQYDLLTHVFRWGGSELVVKTIEHCFKIDIDHYVRLNFTSVKKIVDAIGGIDVEMTQAEANSLNWNKYVDVYDLIEGTNRIDGETALAFARLRKIDSDWQRVGRQRRVILAVVDELKGSSLRELDNLANEVLPLIQTNMSKMDIAELVLYAPKFLESEFDQMTIPKAGTYGGIPIRGGQYGFGVDYEINNDLLYRFLYEGATSEELLAE